MFLIARLKTTHADFLFKREEGRTNAAAILKQVNTTSWKLISKKKNI